MVELSLLKKKRHTITISNPEYDAKWPRRTGCSLKFEISPIYEHGGCVGANRLDEGYIIRCSI